MSEVRMGSVREIDGKNILKAECRQEDLHGQASLTSKNKSSVCPEPRLVADTGWFTGKNETSLFKQWWLPKNPKAAIVIVHGYAEHSGRYAHVAQSFTRNGYAVFSYDHRSHGQSEGKDTFINSFDDFVDDLAIFIQHVRGQQIRPRFGDLPLFILGHSLGGLITSHFMATHQPAVRGVVLTGPYVAVSERFPNWLIGVSQFVGAMAPTLPTIGITYRYVTRDPEMMTLHRADPLIYRGKVPARTGAEMNQAVLRMQTKMQDIVAPMLIMHGGADMIAPVAGSRQLYESAKNNDKTLKIYDGLYHEILNEFERDEVKADILTWMDERYAR